MRSRLHWGLSPTGVYSAPVYLALKRGVFGPPGRTVIDPSNYGYLLYARRSLVAEEPALVADMVQSHAQAVRHAMEHVDDAAATLHGRIPGIEPVDIDRGLRRDMAGWTWDTRLDPAFIERVMAEMREQAVVPPRFDVRQVLAAA